MNIKEMRQRKADLVKEGRTLCDAADEDGNLTEDQDARIEAINEELDRLDVAIGREERLADHERSMTPIGDGNAAIDLAINNKPDLVVLDAMLPKRSGFLVLEKLKSAKQENKFRIIMITGNQGTRHKTWAESLGVDDYINKPFSMDTLLEKADKLLSN